MAILLDHVIVPSRSPIASARVLAEILGVAWEAKDGHFTPVYVTRGGVQFQNTHPFARVFGRIELWLRAGEGIPLNWPSGMPLTRR